MLSVDLVITVCTNQQTFGTKRIEPAAATRKATDYRQIVAAADTTWMGSIKNCKQKMTIFWTAR